MNNEINKSLTLGIGAVMAASLGVSVSASLEDEADTVFVLDSLDDQDILSSDEEGECGEGKCGDEDDDGDDAEGECGEGKCGEEGDDGAEGECGEGKCGEDSDGDEEAEDEGEETTEE